MQPPLELRKVHLYGHLAEGIGKVLELAFRTPLDAIRLLEVNFPGFHKRMAEGHYFVYIKNGDRERDLPLERLELGFTGGSLHIMPRVIGARKGKGFFNMLLGGLIIGAAFFFSGGTVAGLAGGLPGIFGATGATFGTLATMGAGLVLQGVGMMLTPTPKTNYASTEEKASFVFNGPVNVTQQGGAMPLIFGKMMAGTVVLSASLDVEMLQGGEVLEGPKAKDLDVKLSIWKGSSISGYVVELDDLTNLPDGARIKVIDGQVTNTNNAPFVMEIQNLSIMVRPNDQGAALRLRTTSDRTPRKIVFPVVVTTKRGTIYKDVTSTLTVYMHGYVDPPAKNVSYQGTSANGAFTDKSVTG